jgi:hypothetical protein
MVLGGAYTAHGAHIFSDVGFFALFHDATEWLANRGVTLGCAAGLYCPNDLVTRAQMALFLNRLGVVLTPVVLIAEEFVGALDVDSAPIICQTAAHNATYNQRAIVHSRVGDDAGGTPYTVGTYPVFSTNGGMSWSPAASFIAAMWASAAGERQSVSSFGAVDLSPGVSYTFGTRVDRRAGTGDLSAGLCKTQVEIMNRNGTSTPLGGPQQSPASSPGRQPGSERHRAR